MSRFFFSLSFFHSLLSDSWLHDNSHGYFGLDVGTNGISGFHLFHNRDCFTSSLFHKLSCFQACCIVSEANCFSCYFVA